MSGGETGAEGKRNARLQDSRLAVLNSQRARNRRRGKGHALRQERATDQNGAGDAIASSPFDEGNTRMSTVLVCPVCDTEGAWSETGATPDRMSVRCPICNQYEITGTAISVISSWPSAKRRLLSGKVRRYTVSTGGRIQTIGSQLLEQINGPEIGRVLEKQGALISDIAFQSKFPGDVVKLSPFDCVVFDGSPGDELTYHLRSLIERGLLEKRAAIYEAVITAEGWEHVERLRSPVGADRSEIFVAMSFKKELAKAWEVGIKPGVEAAGFKPKRVDSDPHNDKIDDRIMAGIRSAFAIICDVTTQNAGAYFEAGFAMGIGRPVVWTVRQDDLANLHFDTRQFNHIVWSDECDLADRLRDHLMAVFGAGPFHSRVRG